MSQADFKRMIQKLLTHPVKPGPVYVLIERRNNVSKFLIRATLPPVEDFDVLEREFTYKVNEVSTTVTLAKDTPSYDFWAPEESNVTLSLIDLDNAGNRSEPSVRAFKVMDTLPPAKPGDMVTDILQEVADDVPTPTPGA